MEADGTQIQTPVFIQPDSDQPCLLGINAAPSLNLQFLRANDQPLKSTADLTVTEQDSAVAKICLIESTPIPARKLLQYPQEKVGFWKPCELLRWLLSDFTAAEREVLAVVDLVGASLCDLHVEGTDLQS